jgi:hypothetical protein
MAGCNFPLSRLYHKLLSSCAEIVQRAVMQMADTVLAEVQYYCECDDI